MIKMESSVEMIKIGGQEMVLLDGNYVPICSVGGQRLVLVNGEYVSLDDLKDLINKKNK